MPYYPCDTTCPVECIDIIIIIIIISWSLSRFRCLIPVYFPEGKLHPATSGLQDLSNDPCSPQQRCLLQKLCATFHSYFLQPVIQLFRCYPQGSYNNRDHSNLRHIPNLFYFPFQLTVILYSIFSCSFISTLLFPGTAISISCHFLSFLCTITMLGRLCWITRSV